MGAYLAKWEPIWEPISRNAHLGKWDYFPNGHFVSLLANAPESIWDPGHAQMDFGFGRACDLPTQPRLSKSGVVDAAGWSWNPGRGLRPATVLYAKRKRRHTYFRRVCGANFTNGRDHRAYPFWEEARRDHRPQRPRALPQPRAVARVFSSHAAGESAPSRARAAPREKT